MSKVGSLLVSLPGLDGGFPARSRDKENREKKVERTPGGDQRDGSPEKEEVEAGSLLQSQG